MQDRVSRNPGRVLITPEDGSTPFYAIMTRADNPEVEGTKINKNALLKDATAALFGLGTDAVPDDIYLAVKAALDELLTAIGVAPKIATGSYSGKGTYGSSGKNTLTFPFAPKLVIAFRPQMGYTFGADGPASSAHETDAMIAAYPATEVSGQFGGTGNLVFTQMLAWGGNSLSWYCEAVKSGTHYETADSQLNASGITYHYVALGT